MNVAVIQVMVNEDSDDFVEVEVDANLAADPVWLTTAHAPSAGGAAFTLASAVDQVLPALTTMLTRLRRAADVPDEISVEVGLKVGGKSGFVIAHTHGEATVSVRLTWHDVASPAMVPVPAPSPIDADGMVEGGRPAPRRAGDDLL